VTQAEKVGASLWPRVELADPGKGEGGGTLVEFKDNAGRALAALVLGKKVLKKDPVNPLPSAKDGVPAGRYVRVASDKDAVVVVADPLNAAQAAPGRWLNKDFFKVDRIRTLAVGPDGGAPHWKITRTEEWGQWKFAFGNGDLDSSAAVAAVNKLGSLSFNDVEPNPKSEAVEKPVTAVAETFDNLVYTIRIARKGKGNEYLVSIAVTGEPPTVRVAEKGEKPEQAKRADKDFADSRKRLEQRIAAEKALGKWTYVIAKDEIEPLLKGRADMVAKRGEKPPLSPFGGR